MLSGQQPLIAPVGVSVSETGSHGSDESVVAKAGSETPATENLSANVREHITLRHKIALNNGAYHTAALHNAHHFITGQMHPTRRCARPAIKVSPRICESN